MIGNGKTFSASVTFLLFLFQKKCRISAYFFAHRHYIHSTDIGYYIFYYSIKRFYSVAIVQTGLYFRFSKKSQEIGSNYEIVLFMKLQTSGNQFLPTVT